MTVVVNMSSTDPDDHDASDPGFFMKSTIKSISLKFPTVKNVNTPTLAKWLQSSNERTVVLLDSRPEEEFKISHLEKSIRVDHESDDMDGLVKSFENKFQNKPNPTVVCYCSVGYRSSVVAKKLEEYYKKSGRKPVPEIYNLAGSLFQWANERRPMVDINGGLTQFAHPYSNFWGKLLEAPLRKKE